MAGILICSRRWLGCVCSGCIFKGGDALCALVSCRIPACLVPLSWETRYSQTRQRLTTGTSVQCRLSPCPQHLYCTHIHDGQGSSWRNVPQLTALLCLASRLGPPYRDSCFCGAHSHRLTAHHLFMTGHDVCPGVYMRMLSPTSQICSRCEGDRLYHCDLSITHPRHHCSLVERIALRHRRLTPTNFCNTWRFSSSSKT